MSETTRRHIMLGAGAAIGAAAVPTPARADDAPAKPRFRFALNTATIRGQNLPLDEEIDLAIRAGYAGIEPWVNKLHAFVEAGGSLKVLSKRCADAGLAVVSAIGFARWIVDDDAERAKGLEQAKRDMAALRELGGTHIAAPPAGATRGPKIDLDAAAERYHALCEVGRGVGVIPQIEVWGFSPNLGRLAESVYVAVRSGHRDACVLPDVYHLYKGGSAIDGLKLLGRAALHCFHINDYPDLPRDRINDADRVYPGDGVAPIPRIVDHLKANEAYCWLSLELFNRQYWTQDALLVAKTGLAKSRAAVGG